MYYSATVVQMAGIGSASSAIWITAVIINVYDCVYDDTLDDDDG